MLHSSYWPCRSKCDLSCYHLVAVLLRGTCKLRMLGPCMVLFACTAVMRCLSSELCRPPVHLISYEPMLLGLATRWRHAQSVIFLVLTERSSLACRRPLISQLNLTSIKPDVWLWPRAHCSPSLIPLSTVQRCRGIRGRSIVPRHPTTLRRFYPSRCYLGQSWPEKHFLTTSEETGKTSYRGLGDVCRLASTLLGFPWIPTQLGKVHSDTQQEKREEKNPGWQRKNEIKWWKETKRKSSVERKKKYVKEEKEEKNRSEKGIDFWWCKAHKDTFTRIRHPKWSPVYSSFPLNY